MNPKAFRFNRAATYKAGIVDSALPLGAANILHEATSKSKYSIVVAARGDEFDAHMPNILENYRLPAVTSDLIVQTWNRNPMQFWQNQVNFSIWCATTGCGVSHDHMTASDPLIRALYSFHVYYQTRRILAEIKAALPQDESWHPLDNSYDRRAYERICSEFEISPDTDWRRPGVNNGLGKAWNYWRNLGYHVVGASEYTPGVMSAEGAYVPGKMSFQVSNETLHVDYILQDANEAWTTFILDKSNGFTRAGVERINDSIRTYVWAILGAQAQTRTKIIGEGTSFDAQKQFQVLVEDAISSPVDLPAAIERYQDVLQYASCQVDFAFGIGLYMAPSDMLLRIGQLAGYNNQIVIAEEGQQLGLNKGLNVALIPPASAGKKTIGNALREDGDRPEHPRVADTHVDEKTALIVGLAGFGLLVLWAFDRL